MLRRALPLLCLPLCAACPTFSYGPEVYEIQATAQECVDEELDADCTAFELDNGEVFTAATRQPVWLRLGFDAPARNLAYVSLVFEVPGVPPIRRTCAIPSEPIDDDEGFGCAAVRLFGDAGSDSGNPARTAEGVLELETLLVAPEPGPHAISAWLTDAEGLDSPVVRWQFSVIEPLRPMPPSEGEE